MLGRSDFDTGFDSIRGEWTSTIELPLVIHPLLNLGIASEEVIEAFCIRLGTVGREGKVVVLEVKTNAGQVNLAFHAGFLEFLGISNAGALEHKWRAESTTGDYDLLAGFDDFLIQLVRIKRLHGYGADCGGTTILKNDFVDLGVTHKVEIVMVPFVLD